MTTRIAAFTVLAVVLTSERAFSQTSLSREAEITVGRSTDDVTAGGVQGRMYGTIRGPWRVYLEGNWSGVDRVGSDAFGTAFPYDKRLRPMETYVETSSRPGRMLVSVRAGRYRVPFGLSGRSDHGYSGFTRAPLIRYGGNWALSNTSMEAGASVLAGLPALTVEASLGRPLDNGDDPRPATLDSVVRVQGFYRSFVVGVSHLNTKAYAEGPWVTGRMTFTGVDGRWMRGGVQLRGEWINGRPFNSVATRGGYLDVMVHRVRMGPVTAVARAERLDYDAGPFSAYYRRYAAGARVRLPARFSLQINVLGQPHGLPGGRTVALDAGLTQTIPF